ncbi:hypothetical protein DM02DRAFT_559496 [Periconia macrospinosa]|uniref:Cyclase n=1 Tax=Periconia macrospinosa TaxID=97972 RepID=A0A2V1E088_9PLEO|nr:hypothetical protein DM02DRAFT_559496 [Periconia macrospinosa]
MQRPYPSFAELPVNKSGPRGNAWGLWGNDDQLGTLNHLTAERVRDGCREVTTGDRVSLNWQLEGATNPRFQYPRNNLHVNMINKEPRVAAFDDEWSFNTQCSSQWDGCRHYAYQEERLFYMGRKASDFEESPEPSGIHHMAKKGVAGRAFFVDWYRWKMEIKKEKVDAFSSHAIPFSELLAAADHQGTPLASIQPGSILIIRSGYINQYNHMPEAKRTELDTIYQHTKPSNIGVQASQEFLSFLWENRVAAVAGDSRSFEVWPCKDEDKKWQLHQWLLAGWGMPIGELWDLEELSRICTEQNEGKGRWSFFLTSAPMNVKGGVASPPNALAFF